MISSVLRELKWSNGVNCHCDLKLHYWSVDFKSAAPLRCRQAVPLIMPTKGAVPLMFVSDSAARGASNFHLVTITFGAEE